MFGQSLDDLGKAYQSLINKTDNWKTKTINAFKSISVARKAAAEEALRNSFNWGEDGSDIGNANKSSIEEWINQKKAGNKSGMKEAYNSASRAVQEYIDVTDEAKVSTDGFAEHQQDLINNLGKSNVAARAAAVGMKVLKAAVGMAVMAVLQFAIQKLIEQLDELAHKQENLQQAQEEAVSAYRETTEEISSQEEELEKVRDRLNELNSIGHKTLAEQAETDELKRQSAELSYQIALLKEKQEAQERAAKEASDKAWENAHKSGLSNSYDASGNKLKWYEQDWFIRLSNALAAAGNSTSGATYQTIEIPVDYSEVDAAESAINKMNAAQAELNALMSKTINTEDEKNRIAELSKEVNSYKDNLVELASHWEDSENPEAQSLYKEIIYAISDVTTKTELLSSVLDETDATFTIEQLEQLAVSGKLTAENLGTLAGVDTANALNKITGSAANTVDALKAAGEAAKSATDDMMSLSDSISALTSVSETLSVFQDAMADIRDSGSVTLDTIKSISEKFSSIFGTEELDNYIDRILDAGASTQKMSKIFGEMTYAALEAKFGVQELANQDENLIAKMLKEAGVTDSVTAAQKILTQAKFAAKVATLDLSEATAEEINLLIAEAKTSGATAETIKQLTELYIRAQYAAQYAAVQAATNRLAVYNAEIKAANAFNGDDVRAEKRHRQDIDALSSAIAELNAVTANDSVLQQLNALSAGVTVDYDYNVSYKAKSSSSSSSSSSDPRLEAWNEMLATKKHQLEMDQITEEQYYAWLEANYKKQLNNQKKYLDEWRQYEEEIYKWKKQKRLDDWNDAVDTKKHELEMGKIDEGEYYEWLARNYKSYLKDNLEEYRKYQEEIHKFEEQQGKESQDALEELIDLRVDMLKQEKENEKDVLKERQDNVKEFYDKQRDLLKEHYDKIDKEEERREKRKNITDIQAELLELEADDSVEAQKRRLELEEELADAKKDLNDFERDEELEQAEKMYDDLEEMQTEYYDRQIEAIEDYLDDAYALRQQAIKDLQNGNAQLYQEMIEYNRQYGLIQWLTHRVICVKNYTYMRGLPKALHQNKRVETPKWYGAKAERTQGWYTVKP